MINIYGATEADPSDTSLRAYVRATYDELVAVFGEPTERYGDKVTAAWYLRIEYCELGQEPDSTVVTIYDWKEDVTPWRTYDWHIGGHTLDGILGATLVDLLLARYREGRTVFQETIENVEDLMLEQKS